MRPRKTIVPTLTAFLFLAGATTAAGRDERPIETFTAFAAALGTGQTAIIHIDVHRWSTDEERERLLTTLQEFGPDKLLDAREGPAARRRDPNGHLSLLRPLLRP